MVRKGYNSYVGFGVESTYGSAVTPTGFVEYNSEGFKMKREEMIISSINGSRHYKKRLYGKQSVTGSLEFPVVSGAGLPIFIHGIGSASTTAVSTSAYQHTILGGVCSTSITFEVCRDTEDSTSTFRYTGSKINSLELNCSIKDTLNCTIDVVCNDEVRTVNTISTAVYRSFNPFYFIEGNITVGDSLASVTTITVSNFNMKVENGLMDDYGFGSAKINTLQQGMQKVTFSIEARFDDLTLYNRFVNGTKSALKAVFDNGLTITGTTQTHKITIMAGNCYFNGDGANIDKPDQLVKVKFPIQSIYEDASITTVSFAMITDATLTTQ